MQAYHNSSTAEKKNESLSDILYAAADELFADKNSSTTDWRLQRVIQAVTGALEDLNTFTTEPKTGRHLNRRFQSRTEGSVLPTHDHIQSKAVDRVLHIPLLRRLSQYQKWSGKPSSWQLWYQGLNRAYHDDFRTGLDPANADHASRAWNTILDKLPEQVTVKLLNEGVLVPERPDPHQLLVHLNRFISSEYL